MVASVFSRETMEEQQLATDLVLCSKVDSLIMSIADIARQQELMQQKREQALLTHNEAERETLLLLRNKNVPRYPSLRLHVVKGKQRKEVLFDALVEEPSLGPEGATEGGRGGGGKVDRHELSFSERWNKARIVTSGMVSGSKGGRKDKQEGTTGREETSEGRSEAIG